MMGLDALNIVFDVIPAQRMVLYIDQFKEPSTLAKDDGKRQTCISLLSGAATEPDGKLIVLLSIANGLPRLSTELSAIWITV